MPQANGDVWSPVITPFNADLAPHTKRFVSHCQWLHSNGVGLAIFGTNSEANSMSVVEKQALLKALVDGGVDPARVMPGTGACSIDDCVALTQDAVTLGCAGVLMLPPFYYKGVSDEGLFRYFSQVINRIDDSRLRIYLYHIPPVTQVPLSFDLIERLREAFPGIIAGIKDSGGDWAHTQALVERFASDDFAVYAGSERFLLDTLRAGGAGCISATANVNPSAIIDVAQHWQQDDPDERQRRLNVIRDLFEKYPLIPAMKAATAHFSGITDWQRVRPPLVELDDQKASELITLLHEAGFKMEGLDEAKHG
ncbi:dihydrodipicolinate synthase family protein [Halomonas sp. PAMB 3232]|uniref:dihydrodipicolinate synthase family protein n=1 Tax=Halomonas sp. PAMB 3232 TaxID=3075221 RepID=UPI00289A0FBE|nr:dihydrodipicolinate synthase family protein [Halomonas sp. PAMB 3232]WNL40194.1 dihydrodipicolinate synthase family protein [Halomonas sp. PAMB 3232]